MDKSDKNNPVVRFKVTKEQVIRNYEELLRSSGADEQTAKAHGPNVLDWIEIFGMEPDSDQTNRTLLKSVKAEAAARQAESEAVKKYMAAVRNRGEWYLDYAFLVALGRKESFTFGREAIPEPMQSMDQAVRSLVRLQFKLQFDEFDEQEGSKSLLAANNLADQIIKMLTLLINKYDDEFSLRKLRSGTATTLITCPRPKERVAPVEIVFQSFLDWIGSAPQEWQPIEYVILDLVGRILCCTYFQVAGQDRFRTSIDDLLLAIKKLHWDIEGRIKKLQEIIIECRT